MFHSIHYGRLKREKRTKKKIVEIVQRLKGNIKTRDLRCTFHSLHMTFVGTDDNSRFALYRHKWIKWTVSCKLLQGFFSFFFLFHKHLCIFPLRTLPLRRFICDYLCVLTHISKAKRANETDTNTQRWALLCWTLLIYPHRILVHLPS